MRRKRRLEEIAAAFAEAVAEGDLSAAEGWLAVAMFLRTEELIAPAGDAWRADPRRG